MANPDTRKLIARGYRSLAMEGRGGTEDEAIQGLVIWGGKYSVPVLIELMDNEKLSVSEHVFDGLAKSKDPRGAEAVARFLGNFFNHDKAAAALRKMGPVAEDALIKVAPSNDAKVSLAAVQLLGEVGTEQERVAVAEGVIEHEQRHQAGGAGCDQADPPASKGRPAADARGRDRSRFAVCRRCRPGCRHDGPQHSGNSSPFHAVRIRFGRPARREKHPRRFRNG